MSSEQDRKGLNTYTGCYTHKKPDFCKDLKWYESQPSQCVNCMDVELFRYFYIDPKAETIDPDTGESVPNSKLYDFLTVLQEPLDMFMEFTQIKLFPRVTYLLGSFAFLYGIVSKRRIPNSQIQSDIGLDMIGFGNGFFPRVVFAVIFSYFMEGIIKLNNYRARPNLTRGMVSDYDRWMGTNDFTGGDRMEEEKDFFTRSKGPLFGLRSHRSSFPSGHNTGAWTLFFALVLSPMYTDFTGVKQPWGKLMTVFLVVLLILALYQFYARISLGGWHWPSDIAGGVALGLIAALFGGAVWSNPFLIFVVLGLIIGVLWYFNMSMYKLVDNLESTKISNLTELVVLGLGLDVKKFKEYSDILISALSKVSNIFSVLCCFLSFLFLYWLYSSYKPGGGGVGPGTYTLLCIYGSYFIYFASISIGFLFPDEAIMSRDHWTEVKELHLANSASLMNFLVSESYRQKKTPDTPYSLGWFDLRMPLSFPIRNLDPLINKFFGPSTLRYPCGTEEVGVTARSYWEYKKSAQAIADEKCAANQTIRSELKANIASKMSGIWSQIYYVTFVIFMLQLPAYWRLLYRAQSLSARNKAWFFGYFTIALALTGLALAPMFHEFVIYEIPGDLPVPFTKIALGRGAAFFLIPFAFMMLMVAVVAFLSGQGYIPPEREYSIEETKELNLFRIIGTQV